MDQATHNKIVSFIWGIADDVLRDLFKRGKYPDVILPMCVIRRLDAVLEPTKKAVLDEKKMLDEAGITEMKDALCRAAGEAFYNTSPCRWFTQSIQSRKSTTSAFIACRYTMPGPQGFIGRFRKAAAFIITKRNCLISRCPLLHFLAARQP